MSFSSNDPKFRSFWGNLDFLETDKYHWFGLGLGLMIRAALTPPELDVEIIDEHFNPKTIMWFWCKHVSAANSGTKALIICQKRSA